MLSAEFVFSFVGVFGSSGDFHDQIFIFFLVILNLGRNVLIELPKRLVCLNVLLLLLPLPAGIVSSKKHFSHFFTLAFIVAFC